MARQSFEDREREDVFGAVAFFLVNGDPGANRPPKDFVGLYMLRLWRSVSSKNTVQDLTKSKCTDSQQQLGGNVCHVKLAFAYGLDPLTKRNTAV